LVAAAKFLVAATKNLFVVPYFVAVTKPFFSVEVQQDELTKGNDTCFTLDFLETRRD